MTDLNVAHHKPTVKGVAMGIKALLIILDHFLYDRDEFLVLAALANNANDFSYEGRISLPDLSIATQDLDEETLEKSLELLKQESRFDHLEFGYDEETKERYVDYRMILMSRDEWEISHLKYQIKILKEDIETFSSEKIDLLPKGYVYILRCGPYYKIGHTGNPPKRMTQLAIQLPHKPQVIHTIATNMPESLERLFHEHYEAKRLNGEWFDLNADDLNYLCRMARVDLAPA